MSICFRWSPPGDLIGLNKLDGIHDFQYVAECANTKHALLYNLKLMTIEHTQTRKKKFQRQNRKTNAVFAVLQKKREKNDRHTFSNSITSPGATMNEYNQCEKPNAAQIALQLFTCTISPRKNIFCNDVLRCTTIK